MAAARARGEAVAAGHRLRPTFAALAAAEEELGPLFALVEKAASGGLKLSEMVALFWHCRAADIAITRDDFAEGVVSGGLAGATPALKMLLSQILGGQDIAGE